jgi:dihydrofolate reductase
MISLILAMDKNRLIGKNNDLPWHLPADLKYFKEVTSGHTVIMGRKTFESIGKPLPNRTNVILTTRADFQPEGCLVFHSVEQALSAIDKEEEAFVIGGAEIYKQFIPLADKIYITVIDHPFEGDAYFPDLDESEWRMVKAEQGIKDEKNPYDYFFTVWERIKASS